jgi:hypothetical protein
VEYEGRPSGREGIVGGCGMARRGARGDSQQGKKVKVSSSQRPVNKNSVARMAWMVCSGSSTFAQMQRRRQQRKLRKL